MSLFLSLYAQPNKLTLKGLQNVDDQAVRFIKKLLVKDPTERWSASKALNAQFFRIMDDTTKMATTPAQLQETLNMFSSA